MPSLGGCSRSWLLSDAGSTLSRVLMTGWLSWPTKRWMNIARGRRENSILASCEIPHNGSLPPLLRTSSHSSSTACSGGLPPLQCVSRASGPPLQEDSSHSPRILREDRDSVPSPRRSRGRGHHLVLDRLARRL